MCFGKLDRRANERRKRALEAIEAINAGDLFDEVDQYARLCEEVSCIAKRDGCLLGWAKDPITAGRTLQRMLGPSYFGRTGGEVLCFVAGGAGVAITLYLMTCPEASHRPACIVGTAWTAARRHRLREMLDRYGLDVALEAFVRKQNVTERRIRAALSSWPDGIFEAVDTFLAEWVRWTAELLEIHLSFPVLSYYRSQHDNQSWRAAVTSILDTCALLIVVVKNTCPYQTQLIFALARHAIVDLAMVFKTPPLVPDPDRLPAERLVRLRQLLGASGLGLREGASADGKLAVLGAMLPPYIN